MAKKKVVIPKEVLAVHGDSYDEAAENLHCPRGTVKSRVSRARLLVMHEVNDNAPWT